MNRVGYAVGQVLNNRKIELGYFDIEVFDGIRWISLNTEELTVGAESLSEAQQPRRYQVAESPIYDGEWIVHAAKGNVTEIIKVYAEGHEQSAVSDYIEDVTNLFSQTYYQVRISRGNDVETWNCFPAEWSIDRSHVQSHNVRATMSFSIPRLPRIIREVRP